MQHETVFNFTWCKRWGFITWKQSLRQTKRRKDKHRQTSRNTISNSLAVITYFKQNTTVSLSIHLNTAILMPCIIIAKPHRPELRRRSSNTAWEGCEYCGSLCKAQALFCTPGANQQTLLNATAHRSAPHFIFLKYYLVEFEQDREASSRAHTVPQTAAASCHCISPCLISPMCFPTNNGKEHSIT